MSDEIKFIKAGSKWTLGGITSGREPFSEYYASLVAEYLSFNHIAYSIKGHRRCDGNMDYVTECDCYTSENTGSVPAYKLGLRSYRDVLDYCKNLNVGSLNTCLDMLFSDCLLLNTDRHFGNIEFFVDNGSLEVKSLVPIYDNNMSLLPMFLEGYDSFDRCDYLARDGSTFENLYEMLSGYRSYKGALMKLKSFKFSKPDEVGISENRLKFLNDFLQMQVDYLLSL